MSIFGNRPITIQDHTSVGALEFDAHGKVFARAILLDRVEQIEWEVRSEKNEYLATIVGQGNLWAVISGEYDRRYPTTVIPVKKDDVYVVFAELTDGTNVADFSREIEAPNPDLAEQFFISEAVQAGEQIEEIVILAVYGPYARVE